MSPRMKWRANHTVKRAELTVDVLRTDTLSALIQSLLCPWRPQEDAVQKDANLKTVETDAEKFYLRAVARSAVPPDGFDKVEFLLR